MRMGGAKRAKMPYTFLRSFRETKIFSPRETGAKTGCTAQDLSSCQTATFVTLPAGARSR